MGIVRALGIANLVFGAFVVAIAAVVGDRLSVNNRFGICPFGLITSTVGCFEFDEFRLRRCNGTCIAVPFIVVAVLSNVRLPFTMSILWCSGCIKILSSIYMGPPFAHTLFIGLATIGISDGGTARDRVSLIFWASWLLLPASSISDTVEYNFDVLSMLRPSPDCVDSITGTKVSVLVSMLPCHNDCVSDANE